MDLEIRASRRPRNKELMRRIELALVLAQLKSLFHEFAATDLSPLLSRAPLRISDGRRDVGIVEETASIVPIDGILTAPLPFRHRPDP